MLITNSELKYSGVDSLGKKVSWMGRITRAFGNGIQKIISAQLNEDGNAFGHVQFSMSVKESMKQGLSNRPRA